MKARDAISDAPRDGRAPNDPDVLIDVQGPVGYVCKHTPLELLSAFGFEAALIDGEENDFERAETLTHANLCSHAKAVIQQAVAFDAVVLADCCDSLRRAFDVLDGEKSPALLPMLKIETDYTPMPAGQLSTRLQAFSESFCKEAAMTDASRSSSTARPATAVQRLSKRHQKPKAEEGSAAGIRITYPHGRYVAGIDSGSTTTNMVVLDRDGTVAASAIVRTGAKAQNGARTAFDTVLQALGATESDFAAIVATGYGRFNIPFATGTVTEITCHGKGAHFLNPDISTIIDIGGQDSKVICLDERGGVENFIMNDKCAAGTGRFLEAMARTLEITLDEISTAGLTWKEDLSISSMCTVFAESEVISLIADNHSEADIVHGLNKSIAARTASMVARAKGQPPYMMTGGVARNRGVVQMLEAKLDAPLFIAQDPDLCGALGAALFALEAARSVVSV